MTAKSTPMMKQYLRFKAEHPGAILFFHLGDFYEAFFEDAEVLSRELDIVLTSRNGHPMAGVPVRRGTVYMNQLLKKGYKVAVCQQIEDPKKAQGLVKRDVTRVVTPGTALDEEVLDAGSNNYLASVFRPAGVSTYGIAFLDLSTGEFSCTAVASASACRTEVERRSPAEVLVPAGAADLAKIAGDRSITELPLGAFSAVPSDDLGVDEAALCAAGAILAYVETTQKAAQGQVRPLVAYDVADHVDLDPFTVSSLELVHPLRDGQERGTLLHVLDRTSTSMGRRRLRRMILTPLTNRSAIEGRLDAVEVMVEGSLVRQELRDRIRDVHDLERLAGRLGAGRFRPHDLLALLRTIDAVAPLARMLSDGLGDSLPDDLTRVATSLSDPDVEALSESYGRMLVEQPPVDVRDGGIIRDGYNVELDALRQQARGLRQALTNLEAEEKERTGIPSLKVGYNRVFGYYIEVTKPHLDKVPEAYRRRQTLANAERFVTEELSGIEEKIALAEERATALEVELFDEAVGEIAKRVPGLQAVADALAELDVVLGLAETAHRNRYVRPTFTAGHALRFRGGRHAVVEQVEEFVPNDLDLPDGRDLVILTGPNMAGKSVFLRQTALMSLLAQVGSFVPAESAELPIVDRIFARVGASDALVAGVSTFMMEMLEVAAILERATSRSLIILDEMGRGTSTFDGVSIAWAVAEELARKTRAKTLFATHYQELTRLADEVPNVVNLHVSVKEVGSEVVFLHRVVPGTAEGSYGVHVARLAGLPDHVTAEADRILAELLAEAPLSELGGKELAERLPLFGAEDHPVVAKLRRMDPNRMTPLEALRTLAALVAELDAS
jgi:DNA mismatch repair protein MutS